MYSGRHETNVAPLFAASTHAGRKTASMQQRGIDAQDRSKVSYFNSDSAAVDEERIVESQQGSSLTGAASGRRNRGSLEISPIAEDPQIACTTAATSRDEAATATHTTALRRAACTPSGEAAGMRSAPGDPRNDAQGKP